MGVVRWFGGSEELGAQPSVYQEQAIHEPQSALTEVVLGALCHVPHHTKERYCFAACPGIATHILHQARSACERSAHLCRQGPRRNSLLDSTSVHACAT